MKPSTKSQSLQMRADRGRSRGQRNVGVSASAKDDADFGLREEIWQWVAAIPPGHVATYGQIARLAGFPRHARYVGTTLKNLPKGTALPWFRVLRGTGELAFPPGSTAWKRQKALLEEDGVLMRGMKVPLKQYGWEI
jgi:methylated-DNA-protein-cysteine methyltransferase-like protein